MKRFLAIIFLGLVVYGAYWFFFKSSAPVTSTKPVSIKINSHSDVFNRELSIAINSYLDLKNAIPDADTLKIKLLCQKFIMAMDSIPLGELRQDDSTILMAARQEISDIKANAEALLMENSLAEIQQDFRMVSENVYPFLKTIGYEGPKLYWLSCPTAFGENREGNWIDSTKAIRNPYQDKSNPGSAGANCGEIKDSIR